jgi:hypothetical protein
VAERVHRALRIGPKCSAGNEQDSGGAERQERVALINDAGAHRAGGVIAAASRDWDRFHSPRSGDFGPQGSGDLGPFVQSRHLVLGEPGCGQHRVRPGALRHVEPERARRIGEIGRLHAGHAQAHVVFWQQHEACRRKYVRLGLLDPQQLRRGEAGHGEVAGDLAARQCGPLERRTLRGATSVIPQDRWPQRPVGGVDEGCAVHLAR